MLSVIAQAQHYNTERIQQIVNKSAQKKNIPGIVITIKSDSSTFTATAGKMDKNRAYCIASISKMFTTAILMQLVHERKLSLDDTIKKFLPNTLTDRLHIYGGDDYSGFITVRHLVTHTSGLPDYFQGSRNGVVSLYKQLLDGNDQFFNTEQIIDMSRNFEPEFIPGEEGKAMYSETNFQLLGKVLEYICKKPFILIVKERVFEPLNLSSAYLCHNYYDSAYAPVYYGKKIIEVPKALMSFGPDGGILANAEDNATFIEAFFGGKLFPKSYLDSMQNWVDIQYPLQYGTGMMRFNLPAYLNGFKPFPLLIGHSGITGSFAYYCPDKKVFITGTTNQIKHPAFAFRLLMKILDEIH